VITNLENIFLQCCFNPTLGQIWTNLAIGLHFLIRFLTQHLGLTQSWVKTTQHCYYPVCDYKSWKHVFNN